MSDTKGKAKSKAKVKPPRPRIPEWQADCKYVGIFKVEDLPNIPEDAEYVAIDLETTGLDRRTDEIVGVAISWKEKTGYYIPVAHEKTKNVPLKAVINWLNEQVKDKIRIYWNAKFDRPILRREGFICRDYPGFYDAAVCAYNLDASRTNRNKSRLKTFADDILRVKMLDIRQALGLSARRKKGEPEHINFGTVPVDKAILAYACADADCTLRLFNFFRRKDVLSDKYKKTMELDHKLLDAVEYMENCGIAIDIKKLSHIKTVYTKECNEISNYMMEKYGEETDLASSKQMGILIYKKLKVPVEIKTPKGSPATNKEAIHKILKKYGKTHEDLGKILHWRELQKKLNSYVDPLLNGIDPYDNRVHPHYNTSFLITGRLSATGDKFLGKYNIQAVPKEINLDPEMIIRDAFVATPGHTWVSIDWSNVELRIIANYSRDQKMIDAFNSEGSDLHGATAREMFNADKNSDDWKKLRALGKTLNFNLAYTFGVYEIAKRLEMTKEAAQEYYDRFFGKVYPTWGSYKLARQKVARREKKVRTLHGRIIPLYWHYAKTWPSGHKKFNDGDNAALNYPIQGTGADLMRISIIRCYKHFQKNGLLHKVKMLSSIHDELNFEVPGKPGEPEFDKIVNEIKQIMEFTPQKFIVPIVADVTVGPSWGTQYKWLPTVDLETTIELESKLSEIELNKLFSEKLKEFEGGLNEKSTSVQRSAGETGSSVSIQ